MTLLTTSQDILRQTKSADIPSAIIGNNNDAAKQILEAMKLAVVDVSRAYDWQQLQKEVAFNSAASTEGYNLVSDFDRFVNNTFWNTTNQRICIGPKNPQDWRYLKNSTLGGGSINDYFRLRDGQILLYPVPSAIEGYIYEYITNLIVESSIGTGQTGWLADTDVPVVDEYLIKLAATWRLLKMQGKPYAEELKEFDLALNERTSRNGGKETIYHYTQTASTAWPDVVTPV